MSGMAAPKPPRYVDEDANGSFLDLEDPTYRSGSRADALRELGIDPDEPGAAGRYLRARGITVGELPPPTPR